MEFSPMPSQSRFVLGKRLMFLPMPQMRNVQLKLQSTIDLFQQVLNFDKEDDEVESSISIHRPKKREGETA